jgi:diguanylate cyclase (GGDEF)-like protein
VLADAIKRLYAEEDVRHQALHDALTCLPNRVLFSDRLEHAIAAARRDPAPLSVLMIDLNRFKEINDTLGHSTGDQVLREIGPRLTPLLRPGDTLARLGGDEFMVLLPSAGSEQAKEVTGRILAGMREPFALGELTVTVDASVGIVSYPKHSEDAETLVQRADIAMYLAKGRGGGEAVYDPAEDPYDSDRLQLIGDLRDAINDGQLELHYQPQFSAPDLHLVGVEALVRWQHPTSACVSSPKASKTRSHPHCSNITPATSCKASTSAAPSRPTPCLPNSAIQRHTSQRQPPPDPLHSGVKPAQKKRLSRAANEPMKTVEEAAVPTQPPRATPDPSPTNRTARVCV